MNRIKEAIGLYNQLNGLKRNDKMTQRELAIHVFRDRDITDEAKEQLMSWCISEKRKFSLKEIRKICRILQCDIAFIIGL